MEKQEIEFVLIEAIRERAPAFLRKEACRRRFIWIAISFFFFAPAWGQVTPFEKSVLDSLKANDFNLSVAFAYNSSQDGSSTVTTGLDIGMMYSTRICNYELTQSSYYNQFDSYSSSNRFFAMMTGSLFSHNLVGKKLKEKRFYPEPFVIFTYDAVRGLNYRWQFGTNAVYAFKPTKIIRIKLGMGLLAEWQNWQMIPRDQLPYADTFPLPVQKYVFDTLGISSRGELYRNNVRANIYANFICSFAKNIHLNAFFNLQQPFRPPYRGLEQNPYFPVVTKLYPRLIVDSHLSFRVWKKLAFVTGFTLQYDKGQIPLYANNLTYNLTQGLEFDL
jgi:hypothetical protein